MLSGRRRSMNIMTTTRSYLGKLTFGATIIAYSTSDERVEESHYKPGGTVIAALGHWSSHKDPTGCGRWSYACLGKNDKKVAVVTVYHVGHHSTPGEEMAFKQQY
jgi:hypothetical protein